MFYKSYRNTHPNLFACYLSITFSLCNMSFLSESFIYIYIYICWYQRCQFTFSWWLGWIWHCNKMTLFFFSLFGWFEHFKFLGNFRVITFRCIKIYLRNEFHFSGVHGAMNRSGSRAKWMNPEGVHVSFASDPLRFIAPWTTEKLNSLLIFTFIMSSPDRVGRHIVFPRASVCPYACPSQILSAP